MEDRTSAINQRQLNKLKRKVTHGNNKREQGIHR